MKIEVNNQHKKIDLSKLNLNRAAIQTAAFGLSAMMTFFSGSIPVKAATVQEQNSIVSQIDIDYESVDSSTIVEIPEAYKHKIAYECSKEDTDDITVGDLRNIEGILFLNISDNSSLEWLNYCDRVTNLMVNIETDNTEMFQTVESMNNIQSFYIGGGQDCTAAFDGENFSFLQNCPSLTSLSISRMDIPKGAIEGMTNIESLTISGMEYNNSDLDYNELTFLKELSFAYDVPYNIAIKFNSNEYEALNNAGVSIKAEKEGCIEKVCEINNKLDAIVSSLGVDINSTDQEKLNSILIYALENLTYDEEVSNAIIQKIEHSDLSASFYEGGNLYGALEKDSAICGNYAALVSALADRLDLNTYFLISSNHAWNLVTIEGENYYVDATWLEDSTKSIQKIEDKFDEQGRKISSEITFERVLPAQLIQEGATEDLDWYMENPSNISSIEKNNSHEVKNMPSFIKITPIETEETITTIVENNEQSPTEEKVPDITNKKFKVEFGTKTFIIGGGALVGILAGVGVAVHAKKKRERERRRRYLVDNYYSNIDPYTPDYTNYTSKRR